MPSSVVNDFGTWWIESIMTPRVNIAFGTRSNIDVTLTKAGRCMAVVSSGDFDANAARHVSVNLADIDGSEITINKFITGVQFNVNNHGTSDVSCGSKAILFMRP